MKPMIDLKRQYLSLKDEIFSVLNEILESSTYVLGARGRGHPTLLHEHPDAPEDLGIR